MTQSSSRSVDTRRSCASCGKAITAEGPAAGQRTWKDSLKRSACWAGPLLLLIAFPLFWSGSVLAAAGGSLLSVAALLACPLGMYFMMRAMGNMSHGRAGDDGAQRRGPSGAGPGETSAGESGRIR